MQLVFHGGKCCGVKTIFGFNGDPDDKTDALTALKADDSDILCHHVSSDKRFFHEAAPKETYAERLDRYIEYSRRRRPQHVLEAVLANGMYFNQTKWFAELEARGFKLVTSNKNSNSGNKIFIFHLSYDVPAEKYAQQKAAKMAKEGETQA